jgi:hypothetical protein
LLLFFMSRARDIAAEAIADWEDHHQHLSPSDSNESSSPVSADLSPISLRGSAAEDFHLSSRGSAKSASKSAAKRRPAPTLSAPPAPVASPAAVAADPAAKASKAKLRPAEDVFNRIKWDAERFPVDKCVVGWLDRFDGIQEMPFSEFRARTATWTPFHRVRYFKCDDVMIWDRESRLDLVFNKK